MSVRFAPDSFALSLPRKTAFALGPAIGSAFPARTRDGRPALVLPLLGAGTHAHTAVFGNVRLRVFAELDLHIGCLEKSMPAATVECMNEDLLGVFCSLCADLVRRCCGPTARASEVRRVVSEWRDLLRPGTCLSHEAELGLWGELDFLMKCPDLDAAISAWHGPDAAAIDFVRGGVGIECKTARNKHTHSISLDQVRWAETELETFLLSVLVADDAASGTSLPQLVDSISAQLQDDLEFRKRLLRTGYRGEHAASYELRLVACDSWLIPMKHIPRVRQVEPGITNVRYNVDVSGVREHALDAESSAGLFGRLCTCTEEKA